MMTESMKPIIENIERCQEDIITNKTKILHVTKRFDDSDFKIMKNARKIDLCENSLKLIKTFEGEIRINDAKHK